jgi:outer membrane lipoprotein carrier protein
MHMNRRFSSRSAFLLAVVALMATSVPRGLPAQDGPAVAAVAAAREPGSDARAREVAAAVQSFYDQTRDVSAQFFQTYVNRLYDRTERSKGRVIFKKPGRMRWDYELPNGKVIVAGNGRLVVYEPGEPGEKGQVLEQSFRDSDLPQAMAFLMGTGKLEDDFTFRLLDAAREGYASGQVIELLPRKQNPHFERLLFYVESAPALRGLVRRMLIVDASGNRNRFDFSAFKFNSNVSEAQLDWKPPADARRVHM